MLGTHTHIPTADLQILSQGTAYITDIGMVGPKNSVLGVESEIIIRQMLTSMPQKYELAKGDCVFEAVYLEIDNKRKAKKVKQILETVKMA